MKKSFLLLSVCFIVFSGFGQGWVGNGQNLFAVSNSLQLTPLNIGIGTNAPTVQLHTTAGVRFQGLLNDNSQQRIVVQDANGVLSWRDASTIIPAVQNAWLLNGNGGTSPTTNFLGTTDNQRLVFRTNNVERMTILSGGNVGVGVSNPTVKFHATTSPGTMLYPYETGVFEKNGDTKLGVYNSNPSTISSTNGGAAIAFGYSAAMSNGYYPGYEVQYGAATSTDFFLRFNSLNRNAAGAVVNSNSNELVINKGNVGINLGPVSGTPTLPGARLHVNGTVRFQGLPTGAGNVLVIDAAGNVYRSSSSANRVADQSASSSDLNQQVTDLKNEVTELRSLVNSLLASKGNSITRPLFSISPNPTNSELRISTIATQSGPNANKIIVSNILGNEVLRTNSFSNSINIPVSALSNGTYIVSIYNNGQLIQTEKAVIQK